MSRASIDRESELHKALTRALVRTRSLDEAGASRFISLAQHALYQAASRPTDAEALTYARHAQEHLGDARKALRQKVGDCTSLFAECDGLMSAALQELARD